MWEKALANQFTHGHWFQGKHQIGDFWPPAAQELSFWGRGINWTGIEGFDAPPGQKSNFRLIRRDALSLSPAAQAMPVDEEEVLTGINGREKWKDA